MADTAFQTQYRQQFIASFEIRQSLLRSSVTTESMIKGNTATFLVAGSGGASAVTRGVNGLIPARADDLTQTSATLQEWHDLVRKTGFNIFASEGDQVRIMQETCMAVINRKIDADIIAQLDTATIDTGASVTASLALVTKALAALGYAEVPIDEENNLFGLITPGFRAYLMQTKEFASAQYVDVKPFVGPARKMLRWAGVNWIVHPNLTGERTATEKTFVFHRSAIGHAVDTGGIASPVGFDQEQDYSWARCTVYMGSKLLQNSGVVVMNHDGSAFNLS
jgi:Phage capsid protein